MVKPVEVKHISLSDHELISALIIEIVGKAFSRGGKFGRSKRQVLHILLFLFKEAAHFVDGEALQSVVFVELEVVELREGSLCLSSSAIGQVKSLIAQSILTSHIDLQQSVLLSNLLSLQQFGLEEGEELLLLFWFEKRDAAD